MRRPVLLFAVLLLAVVGAAALAPAVGAATRTIAIRSSGLSDRDVTITAGDTVVWRNDDTANHQIVSVTGAFASPVLRRGQQFSVTFQTPGTYRYRDALDARRRFRGVVRVRTAPAVSLSSSASQVVHGTRVMLTGQINSKAEGQQVQIVHQPHGQPSPIVLATVLTGKDGVFGFQAKPTILTTYQAMWGSVTSAAATVEVAPKVTLGRLGRWVTCVYAGRSMQGKKVRVQRKTRFGEWVSIKAVVLGPKSCGRFRLSLPKGVSHLRVKMSVNQAGAGYLAGMSREVAWRRR
jgi:plastocyanin